MYGFYVQLTMPSDKKWKLALSDGNKRRIVTIAAGDVLPGMNAGASLSAVPSPIEGSGTAWVLLGSWALSPARPTPIPPRHECRGFSALLVNIQNRRYPQFPELPGEYG